jgi:hypothetical protein
MSQFKMPNNAPSPGNAAPAAPQARPLATPQPAAPKPAAAAKPAPTQPSMPAMDPKATAAARAQASTFTRTTAPAQRPVGSTKSEAPKAQKAPPPPASPATSDAAAAGKAKASGEVDQDSYTDSFQEKSNITDVKKFWGADEGTGSSAMTRDFDLFDPNLTPVEVENLGNLRGAVHMARLVNHWGKAGVPQEQAVQDAATVLLQFTRPEMARSLFRELDRAPVGHVYPLQIQLAILDQVPGFWPNVSRAPVIENKDALVAGQRIQAGHPFRVHLPATMKLKSFALLTPGQPGYEFEPLRNGVYRMLVDTPGRWTFAVRADLKGKQVVDTFDVDVQEPGGAAASRAG